MRGVGKSLVLAFVFTTVFFFTVMMLAVPIMAMIARLTTAPLQASAVMVTPAWFLQRVGLPAAAVVFLATFLASLHHLKKHPGLGVEPREHLQ